LYIIRGRKKQISKPENFEQMINILKQRVSCFLVKIIQRFGPRSVRISGNTYVFSRDVFNPGFYCTSEFMAGHIQVKPGDHVLDAGTGSGIQAITAARVTQRVIAVDITYDAVKCAKKNAERNGLSNILVIQGDFFSPLNDKAKFDVILFTPPYFEGRPKTALGHALFDPEKKLVKRFFKEARNFLRPGGYVQMIYSSIADPERVLKIAEDFGWQYEVVAEKKITFETFYIYRLMVKG
jgi:release factor glutamine methyltransferase